MGKQQSACGAVALVALASVASADIYFLGGLVAGTTDGSGHRLSDNSALDFTTNPASLPIEPTGGIGATSGGLSDGATLVGASRLQYNLLAGSRSTDFVRITVDGEASFDDAGGAYSGSIGSVGTAEGSFRYVGPAMPFFARRVIDGVPILGPWFTPIPGTGASLDGGIITAGDYSFALLASVDSATNQSETRLSELIIPAPASAIVLCAAFGTLRRRR